MPPPAAANPRVVSGSLEATLYKYKHPDPRGPLYCATAKGKTPEAWALLRRLNCDDLGNIKVILFDNGRPARVVLEIKWPLFSGHYLRSTPPDMKSESIEWRESYAMSNMTWRKAKKELRTFVRAFEELMSRPADWPVGWQQMAEDMAEDMA